MTMDATIGGKIYNVPGGSVHYAHIDFDVSGKSGQILSVEKRPGALLRIEKIKVTESVPGSTYLRMITVETDKGRKEPQFPGGCRIPSVAFSGHSLGGGIRIDACEADKAMEVTVEFIADGEWAVRLSGLAFVPNALRAT